MIKQSLHSNPVPHQVGAQVDATMIIGAHGRKERHVFAHHGKVVARIVEVEDALVFIIFWKQVDADRCAVHDRIGKRRNGVQRLVLRVHFRRGDSRVPQRGGIGPHKRLAPKDAQAVEPRQNGNVRQARGVLLDLAVEKQRLVVHRGSHVVLVMPGPKRVAHDFGPKRKLRIAISVGVVNLTGGVQAVAHEGVKAVGVARNASQHGVHRERHGVVRVNHD